MDKSKFEYQIALSQLEEQERHKRVLEIKAVAILGLASTLLGHLLLSAGDDVGTSSSLCGWTIVAWVLGAGAYAVTIIAAVRVFSFGKWARSPDLAKLRNNLDGHELDKVFRSLADDMRQDIEDNEKRLDNDRFCVSWALFALPIQVLVVALLIFASNWQ